MTLIDGAHYRLPDGTLVEAIPHAPPRWRLDTLDGQPTYLHDDALVWKRLVYDATTEGYAFVPCDLVDDDLQRVSEAA